MSCKICGRSNCIASFHSLEEQERFEVVEGLTESQLRSELVYAKQEIKELEDQIKTLEKEIENHEQTN